MVFRCSVYEKHLISTGLTSESSLKTMASLWDQFQLLQAKLPQTIWARNTFDLVWRAAACDLLQLCNMLDFTSVRP